MNTRIGSPMRTRTVGPIWPFCCSAVDAAVWPAAEDHRGAAVAIAVSPPITDSRIAEPKRWKKWRVDLARQAAAAVERGAGRGERDRDAVGPDQPRPDHVGALLPGLQARSGTGRSGG